MKKTVIGIFLGFLLISPNLVSAVEVQEVYQQNCLKCHGADGKGQTTIGKKFKIKDWTDPGWKSQTSDAKIKENIENGVKDQAGKELMRAYKGKLSPEEINELLQYIQKF